MILTDFGCCYVTRTPNKTECVIIFPYEQVPFKKYSYLDSIKYLLEYFFKNCVKDRRFSEVIRKKHNFKVYANIDTSFDCCFGEATCRKRLFALQGDMTLEKGLRSQHGKDIQLHDSLGSPRRSKRTSYNFC